MVLGKTLECSLDSKETKSVNSKGNQPWIFIGKTDAEAEAPILWLPDAKSWLVGKDPDTWRDWEQEEKGTTEDEMVGWYHRLNGHQFEQIPEDSEGWGSLACCSPWVCKQSIRPSDWTTKNVFLSLRLCLTGGSGQWADLCLHIVIFQEADWLREETRIPFIFLEIYFISQHHPHNLLQQCQISAKCGLRGSGWKDLACVIKRKVFLQVLTLFW